jgi:predicted membrane metal-binding protein
VRILRTIIWVLVLLGFLIFAIYNWQPVELTLWQNLVLETKLPVLAVLAFLIGFVPMWAYHRSIAWSLNRRIRALENSLKHTALARQADSGMMTADTPVDKPGKTMGESADPLAPTESDGGSGK